MLKEIIIGNKTSHQDHAIIPVSFNTTNTTVKVSAIPIIITSVILLLS